MFHSLISFLRCGFLPRALGIGLVGLALSLEGAAPPANDTCAGAVVVPAAGPFPYFTPIIDISLATTNGDPFLPDSCQGNTNVSHSVWFRFTPAVSALYTLSLGPDTATDFGDGNNDTVLAIYSGAGGCAGPFNLLLCDDDTAGAAFPLLTALSTNLVGGTPYYIVAWVGQVSSAGSQGQPLNLQLRVTKPAVPANDNCAGAEIISAGGPFPYLTAVTDATVATDATNELGSACAGSRGIWYKFTPTTPGTYIFSTETDSATTVSDTAMAIFSGSCGALTEIVCIDDVGMRLRAVLTNTIPAGVSRYILVWDLESKPIPGETSVQLRITVAGPPTVATLSASNITSITTTGAVLTMSINANGYSSRYFFEWGPTTSYGSMTLNRALATGLTVPVLKSDTIANFTPGVTYHYRAVGSNSQGKIFGVDRVFVAATNAPALVGPAMLPNGNFRFQFAGNAGQLYGILASSDFIDWLDLGNASDLGGGAFEFIR
ncbi:MAG: hypothetical protein QOF48_1828, partial [Verrucomicrobiota bacterium]